MSKSEAGLPDKKCDALDVLLASILDCSLDAEDADRLKRALEHAKDVLADVEAAPKSGPLKRGLNDSESILAWAVDYLADALAGARGVAQGALSARSAGAPTFTVPEGWNLQRDGATIWVSSPEFSDCGVMHTGKGDAADMLHGLADAMLRSTPSSVAPTSDVLAKIDKALNHVHAICQGTEKWRMCIPARPDTDSDLILCDALEAARSALSAKEESK